MIDALFWKPFPVATLTVRQFLGGRAVQLVAALSMLPCLFALIRLINPDFETARRFMTNWVYTETVIPTLLPFTVMILATLALGSEIEDRTMPYLTLKPIGRLRIVVEKLIGSVVVVTPLIVIGLAITYLIVFQGEAGDNLRMLAAIVVSASIASLAYTSIFILLSLLIYRALLVGIIYTLIWESLLGRFLPGLRVVSVRHFTESIFVGIVDDPRVSMDNPTATSDAIIALIAVSAIAVALATWRLRHMSLD